MLLRILDGYKARGAANGRSTRKPRNAADTQIRSNLSGWDCTPTSPSVSPTYSLTSPKL